VAAASMMIIFGNMSKSDATALVRQHPPANPDAIWGDHGWWQGLANQ